MILDKVLFENKHFQTKIIVVTIPDQRTPNKTARHTPILVSSWLVELVNYFLI